jgi:PhzF family phenazine biosynthesis protein
MLGRHQNDFVANLPFEIISTGVRWLIIPLSSLKAMRALQPNMTLVEETCRAMGAVGATAFSLETEREGYAVHVRSFAPGLGVPEDPVCGTGNGSVAGYIAKHGLMPGKRFEYLAEQGSEILRPGTIVVRAELEKNGKWTIQVGGQAVTVLVGEILL